MKILWKNTQPCAHAHKNKSRFFQKVFNIKVYAHAHKKVGFEG